MGAEKSKDLYHDGETSHIDDTYPNKKSMKFRKNNKRDKKDSESTNIYVEKEPIKKSKSYSAISRHRMNTEKTIPTKSAEVKRSLSDDKLANTASVESMRKIKKAIIETVPQCENQIKLPESNISNISKEQPNQTPKTSMHQLKSKSLGSFTKPSCSLESSRLGESLTREEVEIKKKNSENERENEDLKKQVGFLKQQLQNIEQNDTKVINELKDKVEQLSKLNNSIIDKVGPHPKAKSNKEAQKQSELLEKCYKQISVQNEKLVQQQLEIDQLKRKLVNNTPGSASTSSTNSNNSSERYTQHSAYNYGQASKSQHKFDKTNHHNHSNHNHRHNCKYANQSSQYYYSTSPTYQDSYGRSYYYSQNSYQNAYQSDYYKQNSTLYYDTVTGCYYYQTTVPNSGHNYYYYQNPTTSSPSNSNSYGHASPSHASYSHASQEDNRRAECIVTEVTDDEEEYELSTNRKKEYIDAISIQESAEE